jgi:hypothetical protein
MKKIIIYVDEKSSITLIDDDDMDLSIYTKQVSRLMELSKVSILETTSGSLILKPSKINFIEVSELSSPEICEKIVLPSKTGLGKVKNNLDVIKD